MGALVFIVGLAVGSFLNAYIWRLRHGGSVWRGRSYCPKCKKPLRWYELVPLVSFFAQLGHCRGCRQRIDWQYPIVEAATAVVFLLLFIKIKQAHLIPLWREDLTIVVSWYILAVLIVLFVYDLRYGMVPDEVVLPAVVIALLYMVIMHQTLTAVGYLLLAVVLGTAFFAVQYYGSHGRWLGAGDIRIGALMGAALGWPHILTALVISYMIGGAVGMLLLATGKKKFGQTIPLGTFLTLGTAITFIYGEQIWQWYFRL